MRFAKDGLTDPRKTQCRIQSLHALRLLLMSQSLFQNYLSIINPMRDGV